MKTRAKYREEEAAAKKRNETITENDKSACESNDEDSSSSSSSSLPAALPSRDPYVCVYCGTPCASLYRQLNKNSLSSIKALKCEQCQRIVDPYIEREWLLVLIDCILLRPEAYRHILYNNQDFSRFVHVEEKDMLYQQNDNGNRNPVAVAATTATSRIQSLFQWTLVSSLFHAYLKWQALIHTTQQQNQVQYSQDIPLTMVSNADSSTLLHTMFIVTSILDLLAQWLAIYGFMKILSIVSESSSNTRADSINDNDEKTISKTRKDARSSPPSHSIAYQIYLGLLLPTSFQVVCVLVLLWENSKTTRALGSLLVAFWQCLGISLISVNDGSAPSNQSRFLRVCPPLVGIVSLMAWRFGVDRLLLAMTEMTNFEHLPRTIPCVGFEIDVFGDVVNAIASEDFGRSIEWVSSPLLLCLT